MARLSIMGMRGLPEWGWPGLCERAQRSGLVELSQSSVSRPQKEALRSWLDALVHPCQSCFSLGLLKKQILEAAQLKNTPFVV